MSDNAHFGNAALDVAVAALESLGCKPRLSGNEYVAFCPVHEADASGHTPSLTLRRGDKVDLVVHCHAGCDPKEILNTLDVQSNKPGKAGKAKREPVKIYDYHDADGRLISQKLRYEPKDFLQRWPDGKGDWHWKRKDCPTPPPNVLYRLSEVQAAIAAKQTIYLCEGEKDSDNTRKAGGIATTTVEGAAKEGQRPKWKPEYTEQLSGASMVVLLPHNDDAGRAHMLSVAKELQGRVGDIRWLELPGLPPKGDISDWLDQGHTIEELQQLAATAPAPTITQAKAKASSKPTPPSGTNPYRGTDDGNAALFLNLHGENVCYVPKWEKWLLWSGTHWRLDERMEIERLAADVPRSLYGLAANEADAQQRQWLADLARRVESVAKRNAMLAACKHQVVVHHSELDQGHFLLNCTNGAVDLQTGKLRPHHRADLATHDLAIPYLPAATAPTWLAFLQSTFAGDQELIRFLQKAIGYSLTGDVREQILFIGHGVGSNGKSVLLNILRKLLNKLALQAAPDLLMADRNRRHPTEQADLFAKRLVVCQETEEGRRFNESLLKQLTGGDGIRVRRMHEDFWEFNPTHKIWLSTNHKPEIRGTDYAIWRRIRLIPFNVTFHPQGEGTPVKDPDMERKLTAELPGILAWAVQGCLAWQQDGLQSADAVRQATETYRNDMDVLSAFITECCILQKDAHAKASDLFAEWQKWCEQSGEFAGKQRRFGQALAERGFQKVRWGTGWHYEGIGLLASVPSVPSEQLSPIFTPQTSSGLNLCQKSSQGTQGTLKNGQVYCADCAFFQRGNVSTTGSCTCSACSQRRMGPSLIADQLRDCAHFQPIESFVDGENWGGEQCF
jgi:putative DNA primase/helicase